MKLSFTDLTEAEAILLLNFVVRVRAKGVDTRVRTKGVDTSIAAPKPVPSTGGAGGAGRRKPGRPRKTPVPDPINAEPPAVTPAAATQPILVNDVAASQSAPVGSAPTFEEATKALIALNEKHGLETCRGVLRGMNVERLKDMAPAAYADFISKVELLLRPAV